MEKNKVAHLDYRPRETNRATDALVKNAADLNDSYQRFDFCPDFFETIVLQEGVKMSQASLHSSSFVFVFH